MEGGHCVFADMDGIDRNPVPHWPIPNLFDIHLRCMEKHHFRMYLVACWGADFMTRVMESRVPLILPIVTYGETWDCTIYILY